MAGGTINLNSNNAKMQARILWSSSSNGPNANSSNVYAELQVRRPDGYSTKGTFTGNLNIAGENQSFSVHTTINTSWQTLKSFTKNGVGHNSDGTGTCRIWGELYGPSGTSLSGAYAHNDVNVTLDKIPRYLSITGFSIKIRNINQAAVSWSTSDHGNYTQYSLNGGAWTDSGKYGETVASDSRSGTFYIKDLSPNTTYRVKIKCRRSDSGLWTESNEIRFTTYDYAKISSVPNINIGSSHTIKWTNPDGASTSLRLCKTDGSTIIDYGGVSGGSKNITPTASKIYALTPNSNSYKARYILTTTQNGKTYTSYDDFYFYVTNSNPSFSNFTFVDNNSTTVNLTGNNQKLVKYYSGVKATISVANKAVARNSATMKTYRLVVGGKQQDKSYSSNSNVELNVYNVDDNRITVYAIDSRGNSSLKQLAPQSFIEYFKIAINNVTATRDLGGIGTKVTLSYDGSFWNGNFGKVANAFTSIRYEYKKTNSGTYIKGPTTLNPSKSGNRFSQTIQIQGDLGGNGFNRDNSYDIKLIASDKLSSYEYHMTLIAGTPLLAYHRNGIAIGGPYNPSKGGKLQVYGEIVKL